MYLFGFPPGVAGGSKETIYDTGQPTSHSTVGPTAYGTSHSTSRSTKRNTSTPVYRTTSRSTVKSFPVYSAIPLNSPRFSTSDHFYCSSSPPMSTQFLHGVIYLYFKIGVKADPTVMWHVYGRFFTDNSVDFPSYPGGWIRGMYGSGDKIGNIWTDFTEQFTVADHLSALYLLNDYEFTWPIMGNARIRLVDGFKTTFSYYYYISIVRDPDADCPYFFADYQNVSSVNKTVNTSWNTVIGNHFFTTHWNTGYNTGYNTSHNTAYNTNYVSNWSTSHITYG